MRDDTRFYIDGQWVQPQGVKTLDVIDPATEAVAGRVSLGTAQHVDTAVKAARRAFPAFAALPVSERVALLEKVLEVYKSRAGDLAAAITEEMGAPPTLSRQAQVGAGLVHLQTAIGILKSYAFEEPRGPTLLVKEPIGVCGFITPWNWPMNQLMTKLAPALAVGCTVVLKPSEVAPFSAHIVAEILDEAGVPAGRVQPGRWRGADVVGAAIAAHPGRGHGQSFTGSTRAGIEVARAAAAYGQARVPGAGRQVAQHRAGGRRPEAGRGRRGARGDEQLRPVLQCADPHAGASRPAGRGGRDRSPDGGERTAVGDPSQQMSSSARSASEAQWNKVQKPDRGRGRRKARRWSPAGRGVRTGVDARLVTSGRPCSAT